MITDYNLFKLLHALTFKMMLKAEKHHFQNMQVRVHKVSNTENCIIFIHSLYLGLMRKFSFYKWSINKLWPCYQSKKQPAEGLVPSEFHHEKEGK